MSESGRGGKVEAVATGMEDEYINPFLKRSIQIIVSISLFSFFLSYRLGFTSLWFSNLQFSTTLILPFLVQALDRKYMFLICNGILAFLAKNLKNGSDGGFLNTSYMEDSISSDEPTINIAVNDEPEEHIQLQQDSEEDDDDDDCHELEESRIQEISDATVSTEELNNKFEEFIRKMKEDIRMEAQKQLITVV